MLRGLKMVSLKTILIAGLVAVMLTKKTDTITRTTLKCELLGMRFVSLLGSDYPSGSQSYNPSESPAPQNLSIVFLRWWLRAVWLKRVSLKTLLNIGMYG